MSNKHWLNLTVSATSPFDAGANTINLQNPFNDLRAAINLTTTLNTISIGGDPIVNADQNLMTLSNGIAVGGKAQLNFGRDNNGRTFTVEFGFTAYSVTGSSFITGANGNDTFDLSASISGIIDGGNGDDTFNINAAALAITGLRGGADSDTLNGKDTANIWTINVANSGTLVNDDQTVTFAETEDLNGGCGLGVM